VEEPLAETWDGTEWALRTAPVPAGAAEGNLKGVSCTSSTQCTAVGFFESSSGADEPLVERWNGTVLTQGTAPSPGGAAAARLKSVSCTSSTACTAVGAFESGGEEATLAERWNGSEWAVQDTVDPPGEEGWNWLRGVSCASSAACMAVGTHFERVGTYFIGSPLVERWDGSEWSIESSQNPLPNLTAYLKDVSCVSPNSCTAVGSYSNLSASYWWQEPFAERWNGSSWSMLGVPDPPVPSESWHDRQLEGVSCVEAAACVGVGRGVSAPFGSLGSSQAFSENEFTAPFASYAVTTESPASGSPVDFDATSSEMGLTKPSLCSST